MSYTKVLASQKGFCMKVEFLSSEKQIISNVIRDKIITSTTIVVTLTILEMSSKSSSFVSGKRSGADSFGPTCCENLHLLHNHYHLSRCHHNQHHPNPHCCLLLLHHHLFDFHSQKIPQISKELPIMLWSFPRQFWLFNVYFGDNFFLLKTFLFLGESETSAESETALLWKFQGRLKIVIRRTQINR